MGPSGPIFFCKIKGLSQFSFETAPFLLFMLFVAIRSSSAFDKNSGIMSILHSISQGGIMQLNNSCNGDAMGQFEKAKERLRSLPRDYTFSEARYLLGRLGFKEYQKGKTSGSRVMFYRERDNTKILLHKPHPGDVMSIANTEDLFDKLRSMGDI